MGRETSGVNGFDLGPLLRGQTRICGKSCAGNLLVWLDLTLGRLFKVKCG